MSAKRPGKPQANLIELEALLRQLVDGVANEDSKVRIAQIVSEDPAACDFYAEYIYLHAELRRRLHKDDLPSDADLAPAEHAQKMPAGSPLSLTYWREHRVQFGALALSLTLLFWIGVSWVVFSRFGSGDGDSVASSAHVATVTSLIEPAWGEGATAYELQASLAAGDTLVLTAGFAEVTFEHGAVVLLEAPAEFTVDTRGAGTLEQGRLVARIKKQSQEPEKPGAVAFTISTPLALILDEGTEFGVDVAPDSTTHVDVFEGLVEVTAQGAARTRQSTPLRLAEGQSAYIAPGMGPVEQEQTERFVRTLPEDSGGSHECTATNWLAINMIRPAESTREIIVYAVHAPYQICTALEFDVSKYHGETAAGAGRLTLTLEGGLGVRDDIADYELVLRQLNRQNAAFDSRTASPYFLDGNAQQGRQPWRNNAGEPLENLDYAGSLLDITSSQIASRVGRLPGDTAASGIATGPKISFTIPQATLQAWFDQELPPIVLLGVHSLGSATTPTGEPLSAVDFIRFAQGNAQQSPTLRFDIAEESSVD